MGIKKLLKKAKKKSSKAAKKAGKQVSKAGSSAGKKVSKAASNAGKQVSKAASQTWGDAQVASRKIAKTSANFSAEAEGFANEASKQLEKVGDFTAAIADKAFKAAMNKLVKQILKDNAGLFKEAKKVAEGLQDAADLTGEVVGFAKDLKQKKISGAAVDKEASRLARAVGLDKLID